MLFEIKAVLPYFNCNCLVNLLKGRLKYMDLAQWQARPLIGGLVATIATMAEIGCKNQNGFAGQPASAFSDGLYRRRKTGFAGRQQYGCFAFENDPARHVAQVASIARRNTGSGGQGGPQTSVSAENQQLAIERGRFGQLRCGCGQIGRQASRISSGIGRIGTQTQPLKIMPNEIIVNKC